MLEVVLKEGADDALGWKHNTVRVMAHKLSYAPSLSKTGYPSPPASFLVLPCDDIFHERKYVQDSIFYDVNFWLRCWTW